MWGVTADAESYVLLEQIRKRMSFSETLAAIRKIAFRYPQSSAHLIEEKANGSAIIDTLRDQIPGITPVLPLGGKEARAHAQALSWLRERVLRLKTFTRSMNNMGNVACFL